MTNLENKTSKMPTWRELRKFVGLSGTIFLLAYGDLQSVGGGVLRDLHLNDKPPYIQITSSKRNLIEGGIAALVAGISGVHFATTRIRRQYKNESR